MQSLDDAGVPVEDRQRVLTIASIIQREARFEADCYKVSTGHPEPSRPGNQETFGLLQMDSTAQYGYGEMHDGTVSSSAEALADDNPWNTYVNTGLPVGPIANPGDEAIDAAMHPADGDWLYFVTVNLDTGETVFTDEPRRPQRAVAQWQSVVQRATPTRDADAGRHAPRGLGRPGRAQSVAAAARRRVPRARSGLELRATAGVARPPSTAHSPASTPQWRGSVADDAAEGRRVRGRRPARIAARS